MTVALWRSRLRYYDKHYPPWKRAAARRLIRRGMAAQSRAAAAAHQSGQIDDAELQARLSAYRQVIALLSADARP